MSSDNDVNCLNIGREINCEIAFLQPNERRFVTITGAAILDSGVIDNMVTVSSETADLDIENNTAMASVVVNAVQIQAADLSISVDNETEINQGEAVEFQVSMANNGPNAAETPTADFTMTGLIDTVSVNQGAHWVCQVSDLNVSCEFSGEEMPAGHLSNIVITVQTTRVVTESQGLLITAIISSNTNDPEVSNNSVSSEVGIAGTPTREEILNAMQEALAGTGNRQVNRAIQNISSYCERKFFEALEGLCSELYEVALAGDGETVRTFMEQITPNEVIGQSTSVAEIATAQFRNVGARLSQLRGGGGSGFSTAGLNARYGNGSIPLGMLAYLNQTDDEKDGLARSVTDFISPWGFFVNGTVSMGERDATGRELGFDFDSYGLTAGFDYRLSSKKVIGVAVGYANFDSKIGDKAELKSTGVTLTGYGSFYVNDNFYVDARISYSKPDFDQSRDLDFTIGNTRVQRTAVGETRANQYSVAMSAGYNFYKKSWSITPNASFNYVKTTIDGFSETGAGGFNFIYSEQDLESLVWSAGIKISRAISLKKGVITPQFDFDYNYESKNDGNDIEARFILAPLDEIFIIETDSPDRTYGSAGLGLVYIAANGKQAYINYRSIIGLQGFSRGTFNIGARFEF
ncbi:MAG: autotransporter domain-containing protein [Alcanivoracaceae bacterium]|nr:autotransporter domain-containing protein [Alcanivoracaceae bacterium]